MSLGRRFRAGAVSVLLSAVFLFPQSDPQLEQDLQLMQKLKQGRAQVQKGLRAFQSGQLAAAEKTLQACVAALPQTYDACFVLAQIRYRQEDFPGALNWMDQAEAGFLRLEEIRARIGQDMVLIDLKQRDELSETALDLYVQSLHAQCSQEKLKQASRQLDQRAAGMHGEQSDVQLKEPDLPAEYLYVRGNILFRMRQTAEAERCYRSAIRVDPRHLASYNNLLNLCLLGRRFEEARQWLESAEKLHLKLNPALVAAIRRAR